MRIPNEDRTCGCGSGQLPDKVYDGYGIFLTYTCNKCHKQEMKKYRHDIMSCYDAHEPIDPEDYEGPIYNEDY